jgi:UDP-N-acetylglucosamine 2-epimerase
MRFASIIGARPQFIKLAPVSRALRRSHTEVIIHTGQHYDDGLSGTFFRELGIPPPDYSLDVGSGPHGAQTGRMLEAIEGTLMRERPDGVIVYGDTNSTLAGALAAVKLHIPVAHVEAGLRSFNRALPEEINRIVADHVATRLFCPTELARRRLAAEGVVDGVELVGDVMCDLLLQVRPLLAERANALLPQLDVTPGAYVLATMHRSANTDDPARLRRIMRALGDLALPVVFPLHPRTRYALRRHAIAPAHAIHVVDPVGYLDMLTLERHAFRVITDSGGVQKEAFMLGVPCVTLREDTEWPETVDAGWNVLVGDSPTAIADAARRPAPEAPPGRPFGEGDAAVRIARSLDRWPQA